MKKFCTNNNHKNSQYAIWAGNFNSPSSAEVNTSPYENKVTNKLKDRE